MSDAALFPVPRRRRAPSGVVTVEVGRRTAWLRGSGLGAVLDDAGIPRMRDWHPDRRGVLMCPVDRVDDVLALVEWRDRRPVELTDVDR